MWPVGFLVAAFELLIVAYKHLAVAYGISFPEQRTNLSPLPWEHGVLATGP